MSVTALKLTPSLRAVTARIATALAIAVGFLMVASTAEAAIASSTPNAHVTGTDGNVYASVQIGSTVFVGGIFSHAVDPDTGNTTPRQNLMAVNASTGALEPFQDDVTCLPGSDTAISCSGSSGEVRALATDGTNLFVGGYFTAIGGQSALMWAIVDPTTGTLKPMTAGRTNGRVGAFALDGNRLYVGGAFTKFYGDGHDKKLGAVDLSTNPPSVDTTFEPTVNDVVRGITVLGNHNIVIGGQFSTVDGNSSPYIAELTPANSVLPWADPPILSLWDVTSINGYVYAGRGDGKGGEVLAYNPVGGVEVGHVHSDGDVQSVTTYKGEVIAGGHWATIAGVKGYKKLAAFTVSATKGTFSLDTSWQPQPNSTKGVWSVEGRSTALLVGGAFTMIHGQNAPHFAIFS